MTRLDAGLDARMQDVDALRVEAFVRFGGEPDDFFDARSVSRAVLLEVASATKPHVDSEGLKLDVVPYGPEERDLALEVRGKTLFLRGVQLSFEIVIDGRWK